MRLIIIFSLLVLIAACSAPSKKASNQKFVTGSYDGKTTSKKIKKDLTRGNNHLTEGYEVEATLITKSLIESEENEKGRKNMDSSVKIKSEIDKLLEIFVKKQTCFRVSVHTYSIEKAQFKYWRAKLKSPDGKLQELKFYNVSGVESVPTTYKDWNGRTWHNISSACTSKKINLLKNFSVFFLPQLNQTKDPNSELVWIMDPSSIKKTAKKRRQPASEGFGF